MKMITPFNPDLREDLPFHILPRNRCPFVINLVYQCIDFVGFYPSELTGKAENKYVIKCAFGKIKHVSFTPCSGFGT